MKNLDLYGLLKYPIVTEKSHAISSNNTLKYVFEVSLKADKTKISKIVSSFFKVEVAKVNVINIKGKVKRYKGIVGRRNQKRKAIITLKPGHKISVLEEGGLK